MNLLLALLFVTAEIHSVPYGAKLVITGHNYWVGTITYSSDGKLIVTGGGDGEIYVWDARTGEFVRGLHKHLSNVTDIEAVPNTDYAVSVGEDGYWVTWNIKTGQIVSQSDLGSPITSYAYSPDGKFYAIGFEDGHVVRYNGENGAVIDTLSLDAAITDMIFLPGDMLAVATDGGVVRLYKKDGTYLESKYGDISISSVAYSPSRKLLVAGGSDGFLYFLNPSNFKEAMKPIEAHAGAVTDLGFANGYLVSSSSDSTVKVWELDRRAPKRTFTTSYGEIYSMTISPDGQFIVAGTDNGQIIIWDIPNNKLVTVHSRQYGGWVTAMAFTPDGKHILSTGFDGVVHLWNTDDGSLLWKEALGEIATISPDGKYFVVGGGRDTILVYDIQNSSIVAQIPSIGDLVFFIEFSPDGKYMAFGGMRRQLMIYETSTWKPAIDKKFGDPMGVRSCEFVGDKIAIGGFDGKISVFEIATGKELRSWKAHDNAITSLIYRDGQLYSTSRDGTFKIWDFNTGKLIRNIKAFDRNITSMVVMPNGSAVFTASLGGSIKVWNPGNGNLIKEISGYQDGIPSLALTPDGKYLASGGIDGQIIIWEVDAILPK